MYTCNFISYVAFPLSNHFVDEVKVISSTRVVTSAQWTKCLPREFWKEIEESNLEIPGLLWVSIVCEEDLALPGSVRIIGRIEAGEIAWGLRHFCLNIIYSERKTKV